ncbi:MAG: carbamoyl phosphate synthase small subunit [Oscillospiraceae bacterium]|nr:carbamoyl phosphate synthase small subunit [Oscillospiraceae bacterium]
MEKAYLILETGEIFEGKGFGAVSESIGELVFNTSVVGYVETLTDPNYYGQTLMFTFPQLGNYGIVPIDSENTKCYVKGVVAHEWCQEPSNFRCMGNIDEFLKQQGVCGICGVDTRRLTQIVRDHGVMNAIITNKVPENMLSDLHNYKVTGAVEAVSIREPAVFIPEGEEKYHVVVADFGAKKHLIRELTGRGCKVTVVPYNTTAEDILALNPNGVVLTEGPGDPAENTGCIEEVKKLMGKVPMYAVGLGHQILALAAGAQTGKLKFGHHGSNQPVKNVKTGRSYVTAQNHNYYVTAESVEGTAAEISYISLNDKSCEGLEYPGMKAFSLQFTPDYTGSMRDMENVYDRFVNMMGGND